MSPSESVMFSSLILLLPISLQSVFLNDDLQDGGFLEFWILSVPKLFHKGSLGSAPFSKDCFTPSGGLFISLGSKRSLQIQVEFANLKMVS